MIEHEYSFRVMYPDTDQMGTVHHSNYAKYYETARWELFRSIGISYNSIEEFGVMLPVIKMNFKFHKTTHYDELLTVRTTLKAIKGVRIWFTYHLFNEKKEMINEAEIQVAFVNKENWKPCPPPAFVLDAIEKHSTNNDTE
ncbi:MAG: acyl-CoA thioesterase [Bacteroidales bacterium]|nr:acyl-CoA thioesterase [Bacteroidales bacterium]